jgi:hypothetical protein
MFGLGRKADGRLSELHSEKPAIECARQLHQIFASTDNQLSCGSLANAKSVNFASGTAKRGGAENGGFSLSRIRNGR